MSGRGGSAVSIRPPDDEVAGGVAGGVPGPKPGLCASSLLGPFGGSPFGPVGGLPLGPVGLPIGPVPRVPEGGGSGGRPNPGLSRGFVVKSAIAPRIPPNTPRPNHSHHGKLDFLQTIWGGTVGASVFVLSSSSSLFSAGTLPRHAHVRHQSVLSSEKVTGVGPTDARPRDDRFHCSKFGSGGSPPVMSLMTTQFVTP